MIKTKFEGKHFCEPGPSKMDIVSVLFFDVNNTDYRLYYHGFRLVLFTSNFISNDYPSRL
jgi:hypothetical protein